MLDSCVGEPEKLEEKDLAITLTRAKGYLILFKDYQLWLAHSSLQPLLKRKELLREREVSLL